MSLGPILSRSELPQMAAPKFGKVNHTLMNTEAPADDQSKMEILKEPPLAK